MPRLFVGLSIPDTARDQLAFLQSGLRGAKWRPRENFHLTLRFIGEVDGHMFREALSALARIDAPGFEMALAGVGYFGDKRPRAVWAGVDAPPALGHLQAKVETVCQRIGLAPERRKFTPHVTLAYLAGARRPAVAAYAAEHGLFRTQPFTVDAFHLYSSRLGGAASAYRIEKSHALGSAPPQPRFPDHE